MPKRLIDDSLLSSPSLAKCSPRAQDAFPRFILLMDDFGCAEANPRVLVGRGWPLRDDVCERDVWGWLEEYVVAGMACLWTEKERRWVHLTGWFGTHGQRHRQEYDGSTVQGRKGSKRRTPAPPAELVAAVVAGVRRDHDGKPPGVDREDCAESPNDSVPGRDNGGNLPGNTESRRASAHAVPVPVPVPDHIHRRKPRLVSPFPEGQDPYPQTTMVQAALFERGIDSAPPAAKSAARVEAAIVAAGFEAAVERLAVVLSDPEAPRPLTYHVDAIRAEPKPKRAAVGDLGTDLGPAWPTRLTREEVDAFRRERNEIASGFEDAPLAIVGPEREFAGLIDKWRAIAEGRNA